MSRFAYRRGTGAQNRVMHLVRYGPLGNVTGVLCDIDYPLDTTINLPLGLRICRNCRKIETAILARGHQ